MMYIDALFRFSGLSFLLIIFVFACSNIRKWQPAKYLAAACFSLMALFIGFTFPPLRPEGPLLVLVRLIDSFHLVFIWYFALSLYTDNFRLKPWHTLLGAAHVTPILYLRLYELFNLPDVRQFFFMSINITTLVICAHLVYFIFKDWTSDLLEMRRRSRIYFIGLLILCIALALCSEVFQFRPFGIKVTTLKVLSIWPGIIFALFWLIRFDMDAVTFRKASINVGGLTQSEKKTWDALESMMQYNKIFKEDNISVKRLASKIGTTQHTLRHILNTKMGYKNFSDYLNYYRVSDVKTIMNDPDRQDMAITKIAFEAGFQSISSFNRAFKAETGKTPSQYKKSLR